MSPRPACRRLLRRGEFTSRADLADKITSFAVRYNRTARLGGLISLRDDPGLLAGLGSCPAPCQHGLHRLGDPIGAGAAEHLFHLPCDAAPWFPLDLGSDSLIAGTCWKRLEWPIVSAMDEHVEVLEQRIERLRVAVRVAVVAGDRERTRTLRADLRRAEHDWEEALAQIEGSASDEGAEPGAGAESDEGARSGTGVPPGVATRNGGQPLGPLLPLREQVHQALSLLTVPAAPRLIATVHEAFFASAFPTARVTSLRRDEERSFRSAPFARGYYICAALTADLLAPARGLLAISTWPMERRVIGSLSSRVDFLTAASQIAEAVDRLPGPPPAARRLLWRFAASIPGAAQKAAGMEPRQVIRAAQAELEVHQAEDLAIRRAATGRARRQLDDAAQLFGSRLRVSSRGIGTRGTAS